MRLEVDPNGGYFVGGELWWVATAAAEVGHLWVLPLCVKALQALCNSAGRTSRTQRSSSVGGTGWLKQRFDTQPLGNQASNHVSMLHINFDNEVHRTSRVGDSYFGA